MSAYKVKPQVSFRLSAGKLLWGQYGGVSDRRQRAFLHIIANTLRDQKKMVRSAIGITNVNPRALCHFAMPANLRTPLNGSGAAVFVTPFGGSSEGVHDLYDNWQGTIQPDHAILLTELAQQYTIAKNSDVLNKFNDAMLGINIYPMATSLTSQNEVRAAAHQLETKTAQGSIDWATANSDYSDLPLIQSLSDRLEGLSTIQSIIGTDGSPERAAYMKWYATALSARWAKTLGEKIKIRINPENENDKRTREVSRDDVAHDTAAIICATLDRGQLKMVPRKQNPNEMFFLMELKGFARCYEDKLPGSVDEIPSTSHHLFGDTTMIKVVVKRHTAFHWEITSIRPLAAELIGSEATAAADPKIQEITSAPYKHRQLEKIEVLGSEVAKPLFGFVPPRLTSLFAARMERRAAKLPETAKFTSKPVVS